MPGKGQRRRLRNQKLARSQLQNLKSGNYFAADVHKVDLKHKHKHKEEALPKSLRRIIAFTEGPGPVKEKEQEKQASKPQASTSKGKNAKAKGELSVNQDKLKSSKKGESHSNGQQKDKSKANANVQESNKTHKGKRKQAPEANEDTNKYKFVQDSSHGRLKLVAPKGQRKKKKGYLDIRKERKKLKKNRVQDDEDDDLGYDRRNFFDEVAYEPPKLAFQKAKQMMKFNVK